MARVPAALALISLMALSLAACGSPETPAATEQTAVAEPAAEQSPVMPEDAPPQEEEPAPEGEQPITADRTCTDEIGAAAATRLVERCIMVSPATRPPCNATNPCEMIQGEIDRSCAMYGPGETKPEECAA